MKFIDVLNTSSRIWLTVIASDLLEVQSITTSFFLHHLSTIIVADLIELMDVMAGRLAEGFKAAIL